MASLVARGWPYRARRAKKRSMTDIARLDALEIRIAHQDQVIEDLNQTVIAQWAEIDRLSRQLARLIEHIATAAEPAGRDPGDEPPPPHW